LSRDRYTKYFAGRSFRLFYIFNEVSKSLVFCAPFSTLENYAYCDPNKSKNNEDDRESH